MPDISEKLMSSVKKKIKKKLENERKEIIKKFGQHRQHMERELRRVERSIIQE